MWHFKTKLIIPQYVLRTSDHHYVTDPVTWSSVKKKEPKKGLPGIPQVVNYRRFGKFAHSFVL